MTIKRVMRKTVFNVDVPEGTDLKALCAYPNQVDEVLVDEVEEWYEPFGMPDDPEPPASAPLAADVEWPRHCEGGLSDACVTRATQIVEDAGGRLAALCDPCADEYARLKNAHLAKEAQTTKGAI